ncbi:MAG: winged helix-turn-helix domain-containing protein [Anaerolineales bacterium]
MMPTLPEKVKMLAENQAENCRVMGNAQRVLILWLLMQERRTASEIAEMLGASLASVHHHLRILEFHDLIEIREVERCFFYSIKDNEFTRNCPALGNRPSDCENQSEFI